MNQFRHETASYNSVAIKTRFVRFNPDIKADISCLCSSKMLHFGDAAELDGL